MNPDNNEVANDIADDILRAKGKTKAGTWKRDSNRDLIVTHAERLLNRGLSKEEVTDIFGDVRRALLDELSA